MVNWRLMTIRNRYKLTEKQKVSQVKDSVYTRKKAEEALVSQSGGGHRAKLLSRQESYRKRESES